MHGAQHPSLLSGKSSFNTHCTVGLMEESLLSTVPITIFFVSNFTVAQSFPQKQEFIL